MTPPTPSAPPPRGQGDFAARSISAWLALAAVVMLVVVGVVAAQGYPGAALAGGAWLAGAFAVLTLAARRCSLVGSVVGLLMATAGMLGLAAVDQSAFFLLFALFPLVFVLLEFRVAVGAAVAITLAYSLESVALNGWTTRAWVVSGLGAAVTLGFALGMGYFVDRIVTESRTHQQTAVALREAQEQLAVASREAGVRAERERLSREIHDTVAQGLASIVVLAEAGQAAAARGDAAEVGRRFAEVAATARDNLGEARALVGDLAPPALDSGLVPAVRRLVARYAAETGTPAEVEVVGEVRTLSPTSEVAALRATQEALANVRRHAGARRVGVQLAFDGDGAMLTVSDDGDGFDPSGPRAGYGLDGLASRVASVGGLAEVESSPGAGTRVRVRVP